MSNKPKVHEYKNLTTLTTKLRADIQDFDVILLFAYNRSGKTRLCGEFKERGKRKNHGVPDTFYFNAYTEDLFTWENDLEHDTERHIKINADSKFFAGIRELALDETIAGYLSRYAEFDFDIDYDNWTIRFRKEDHENIKISRGEQYIFIWCLFMAICERVIDGHESYRWVKYLYVDDPISSLDDNNAIAVACDLAALLRTAATRSPDPIKVIFSSHHSLFFNVMCNELGRPKEGQPKLKTKRYFLHRPSGEGVYTLRATEDTPYFHHVATLAELQRAVTSGSLYTHHFNALRSILEKIASFFGHDDLKVCLIGLEDEALYNRALNLLSHGKYSITEPVEMGDDNKLLFGRILHDVLDRFKFALPALIAADQQPEP
ncbi:MAG: AAA family ATPase [Fimbriimonadales bacterium]